MNPPKGIKALPNGQWVLVDDTHISRWAEKHGQIISDPNLMDFLRPHLEKVDVIWDIGAFIGDHTRFYCDLKKLVIAVEPNPLAYACLEHNCPDARCFNIAASDTKGILNFVKSPNAGASHLVDDPYGQVLAARIDDVVTTLPGYIKIDVEGWEMNALMGMENTIHEAKPIVYIEVNRGALRRAGADPQEIVDFFTGMGYTRFDVYPAKAKWGDPQFDLLIQP